MGKKTIGLTSRRAFYGYLFILPFILGFIFFMVKPLCQSLNMAFSEVGISNEGFNIVWNNFANFKRALTVDPDFNRLITEAVTQMIYRSLATIVFSFFVALLLNQKFKGRALARSIFFLAVILSSGVLVGLEYNNTLMQQLKETIEEAGNVFPTVAANIKGGIAIAYRDKEKNFGKIGSYTKRDELDTILEKVRSHKDFISGGIEYASVTL